LISPSDDRRLGGIGQRLVGANTDGKAVIRRRAGPGVGWILTLTMGDFLIPEAETGDLLRNHGADIIRRW